MNATKVSIVDQYHNSRVSVKDAIKTLRTNIQFSSIDKDLETLVVTSVLPHEGKSTLSIYLGIAMAEYGKRVLMVEGDCRRPMLANYLGLRPKLNLTDVISGKALPMQAVMKTNQDGLYFMDSVRLADPVEVLGSNRFWSMIETLKENFDIIIIDTPPLGSFIEAAVLSAKADGALLVIQSGYTDIKAAQGVVSQLEKAQARILGVVLNGVTQSNESYYSDYYYSGDGVRTSRRRRSKAPRPPADGMDLVVPEN